MTNNGELDPNEAWNKLHPVHQDRLKKAVQLLAETHGKRLSLPAQHVWCRALAPYAEGKRLWSAFVQAAEDDRMPSIGGFKRTMMPRPELSSYQPPPPLTEEQQRRSDQAATMSMLWLAYEKGWKPSDFSGDLYRRVFADVVKHHAAGTEEFMRAAMDAFDADTVRRWMQGQIAAGN